MNKLSDVNKEIIYEKIATFISKINDDIKHLLFDVLINFIKTSNNNIYIDVLYLFDDAYIEINVTKFYLNYLNEKLWLPKDIIVDYKNIFDEENYDTYCEYVKIKKTTLSMLKALIVILNKLNKNDIIKKIVNHIFTDLNSYISNKNYKHLNELLLDEILILFDYLGNDNDNDNINMIKNINLENLDNSTKFKINNIIDKY